MQSARFVRSYSLLLIGMLLAFSCTGTTREGQPIHLEIFVSPVAADSGELVTIVSEVARALSPHVRVSVGYVGSWRGDGFARPEGDAGRAEMAQLCAARRWPDRHLELVACQARSPGAAGTSWRTCATRLQLPPGSLEACLKGGEGADLLRAAYGRARERGIEEAPTLLLDGEAYAGTPSVRALSLELCKRAGLAGTAACRRASEPPPAISAVLLGDARCTTCDASTWKQLVQSSVARLSWAEVDYRTPEGKALWNELRDMSSGIRLPVILLRGELERDPDAMRRLETAALALDQTDRRVVTFGRFDPTAELCDSGVDDDGDGRVDCDDTACAALPACRPPRPRSLDLYLPSYAMVLVADGVPALEAAREMVTLFGDDLTLGVHFTGIRGDNDYARDVLQRCAVERHARDHAYLDYLICTTGLEVARDWQAGWRDCARAATIDPAALEACAKETGVASLYADFAEADAAKLGALGPVFVIDNREVVELTSAQSLAESYCRRHPRLSGCAKYAAAR